MISITLIQVLPTITNHSRGRGAVAVQAVGVCVSVKLTNNWLGSLGLKGIMRGGETTNHNIVMSRIFPSRNKTLASIPTPQQRKPPLNHCILGLVLLSAILSEQFPVQRGPSLAQFDCRFLSPVWSESRSYSALWRPQWLKYNQIRAAEFIPFQSNCCNSNQSQNLHLF